MHRHQRATLSYVDVLLYMADVFTAISPMYLLREHRGREPHNIEATDTNFKITTQMQHFLADNFLCCSKVGQL
jgi:hypothetical protein